MKNQLITLIFLLAAILCSSCSSNRNLVLKKQRAKQLSQSLGFSVNHKDNLRLFEEINQWLGTPYRCGGTTRTGVDCSGFIGAVYQNVYHRQLERTVESIYQHNCQRIGKRNLKTGDLLFFALTKKRRKLSHVGIYLKQDYFAHASSSKGVIISRLNEPYYKKGWKKSGRIR